MFLKKQGALIALSIGCLMGVFVNQPAFADCNRPKIERFNVDKKLTIKDVSDNPFIQLKKWVRTSKKEGNPFSKAAALATVKSDDTPAVRIITILEITKDCITFKTNPDSDKVKQFTENPNVALCFNFSTNDIRQIRQVRVEGTVAPVGPQEMIEIEWKGEIISAPVQLYCITPTSFVFSQSRKIVRRRVLRDQIQYAKTGLESNTWALSKSSALQKGY